MKRPRLRPAAVLRLNAYAILERAVEEGIERGWNRARKHTDEPDPDTIKTAIEQAVMDAIGEVMETTE